MSRRTSLITWLIGLTQGSDRAQGARGRETPSIYSLLCLLAGGGGFCRDAEGRVNCWSGENDCANLRGTVGNNHFDFISDDQHVRKSDESTNLILNRIASDDRGALRDLSPRAAQATFIVLSAIRPPHQAGCHQYEAAPAIIR